MKIVITSISAILLFIVSCSESTTVPNEPGSYIIVLEDGFNELNEQIWLNNGSVLETSFGTPKPSLSCDNGASYNMQNNFSVSTYNPITIRVQIAFKNSGSSGRFKIVDTTGIQGNGAEIWLNSGSQLSVTSYIGSKTSTKMFPLDSSFHKYTFKPQYNGKAEWFRDDSLLLTDSNFLGGRIRTNFTSQGTGVRYDNFIITVP